MIEILISSTVLILIICGIRAFWKGKINLHLQYALWLLVAIRLFPFGLLMNANIPKIESPISIMRSFNQLSTILSDTKETTESDLLFDDTTSMDNSKVIPSTTEQSSNTESKTSNSSPQEIDPKWDLTNLKIIARTIWYTGMILTTLWILYVNLRFHKSIKKDRILLNTVICQLPVYVSTSINTPMLLMINGKFGIYVTQECVDDESKMKHALIHELCHYKHLDYLWSLVRSILLITYWFNPFVWLATVLSKRDCELSCDASALKILGDEERFNYGRTILEFAVKANNRNSILHVATGMSESKSGMKERIKQISKKSKMMVGTCISILVIVVIVVIITFTTAPKKTNALSYAEEKDTITNGEGSVATENTDLSKLLNPKDQTKGFDNGYYLKDDQFITPDGAIESLADFTDNIIINKYYGSCVWNEVNRELEDGFSKSFSKLIGVSYWLTLDAKEETTITIDYSTTATNTTLKTILVLPDETIIELKNNESNTITIPEGKSEITIVAFHAAGEVNLKFSNLTEAISIKKTEY